MSAVRLGANAVQGSIITPRLKKTDLDPADPKSYRPIANLSVLLKLLVAQQLACLLELITAAEVLLLQSAYRA